MLPKQKKMDSAKKSRRGGVAKSAVKSKVTHVKKTARKIVDGARGQRNDEAKNLLEQQATVVESPRRGGRRGGIATATAKPFSAKKASSPRKRINGLKMSSSKLSSVSLKSSHENSIEMAEEAKEDEVDNGARRPGLMTRALSTILPGTVPYGAIDSDEDSSKNGRGTSPANGGSAHQPAASGKADKNGGPVNGNAEKGPGGQSSCSIS